MIAKRLGLVLLVVGVVACGKSKEEQALEEIGRQCAALNGSGTTIRAAEAAVLRFAYARYGPLCPQPPSSFVDLEGATCPPQTEDPQCQVFYYWSSSDPNLCGVQGGCCYLCELRITQSSIPQPGQAGSVLDAPICGARWLPRQPCI